MSLSKAEQHHRDHKPPQVVGARNSRCAHSAAGAWISCRGMDQTTAQRQQLGLSAPTRVTRSQADAAQYVVIVVDLEIIEVDVYGPMTMGSARTQVQALRSDLDSGGEEFADVAIRIVALRSSAPSLVPLAVRRVLQWATAHKLRPTRRRKVG